VGGTKGADELFFPGLWSGWTETSARNQAAFRAQNREHVPRLFDLDFLLVADFDQA
jgi:hypothetical protein